MTESRTSAWLPVVGYFVVFFAAMTLGGIMFALGGIAIVLIPGALPSWAYVAYLGCGIIGSVVIALFAANGAFRLAARRSAASTATAEAGRRPGVLAWVAGIVGTIIASVASAVLGAVILNWLQ